MIPESAFKETERKIESLKQTEMDAEGRSLFGTSNSDTVCVCLFLWLFAHVCVCVCVHMRMCVCVE